MLVAAVHEAVGRNGLARTIPEVRTCRLGFV